MRMLLSATILSFGVVYPVFAQAPLEPIRLSLHPAAPAKPSLKYRLLPNHSELEAGNAAAGYYRALAMFFENPGLLQEIKKEYWSNWQSLPVGEFPLIEARGKVKQCAHLIREMEIAARKRTCDWQLDNRPEGMGLLLPDAQGYRSVANILAVQARLQIAEHDYDAAIRTLQTGFSLGKHLGAGPSFIHILIGVAITSSMNRQVDELIQQPGSPNLYWALTALPRPFFTLDHALREEDTMVQRTLPWLKDVENRPMTDSDVKAARAASEKMLDEFGVRRPDNNDRNRELLLTAALPAAKKALRDQGTSEAEISRMPAFQIVALHAAREYRLACAEVAKWNHVADGWRNPAYQDDAKRYSEAVGRLDVLFFQGLLGGLMDGLAPSAPKIAGAIDRVDRRIAAQRCVEAIRAHAAHLRRFPASLDDVSELPVPTDPVTQSPFNYKVDGRNSATLSAAAPAGDVGNRLALAYNLRLIDTDDPTKPRAKPGPKESNK